LQRFDRSTQFFFDHNAFVWNNLHCPVVEQRDHVAILVGPNIYLTCVELPNVLNEKVPYQYTLGFAVNLARVNTSTDDADFAPGAKVILHAPDQRLDRVTNHATTGTAFIDGNGLVKIKPKPTFCAHDSLS
jgi:hypothetical protein